MNDECQQARTIGLFNPLGSKHAPRLIDVQFVAQVCQRLLNFLFRVCFVLGQDGDDG